MKTRNGKRGLAWLCIAIVLLTGKMDVSAQVDITSPSAILIEASTGEVIFEKDADTRRSPASITKIMTLLLTFEAIEAGKINLTDQVLVSEHASSMGGSQVFLAEGEKQSLDTMIKCIVISSGNDASVAVAEHVAGSEDSFVDLMNKKAKALGMENTNFEDCCGLTDSENHYSSARDVAIMSRELITKYPQIYDYTMIWMENITHETKQGSSLFTLSSTNKLLKQYPYTTGLKTGSTSKAGFCVSATARKEDMDMIAVILGSQEGKTRFNEAKALLSYGFNVSDVYIDENKNVLPPVTLEGAMQEFVDVKYAGEFRYLDTKGNDLSKVETKVRLPEMVQAPIDAGAKAGEVIYSLNGTPIGSVDILFAESVEEAGYKDYLYKIFMDFLM
ncbi:MAG: D-alanyl-D-alanine carboxypeptidase [Lachnospiraceae bacterium]|nr:D-alanyl-D-alanine carboxypeptidase [Lachnospiraceae bacterium]